MINDHLCKGMFVFDLDCTGITVCFNKLIHLINGWASLIYISDYVQNC